MARVPLIQEQDHPELAEVMEKYRAGRRGKLINIYRMLLNSPALAESWFNHSNAVRWKTALDGRLREIVIIRMGHLTKSQYVLRQHVPSLALADGLSLEDEPDDAWRRMLAFMDVPCSIEDAFATRLRVGHRRVWRSSCAAIWPARRGSRR